LHFNPSSPAYGGSVDRSGFAPRNWTSRILLLRGLAGPRSTRADTSKNHLPNSVAIYKKYAGLGLSELRELRQLREENGKLKRLVADLSLDRHILQEIVQKKL
jgi:hypothetical protein